MATTIKYSRYPMGYTTNGYRYTNSDIQGSGKANFPANARRMDSAPMGSTPIKIYEPNGAACWAIHHRDAWQKLEPYQDAGGVTRWKMNGSFVNNPVAWSSS